MKLLLISTSIMAIALAYHRGHIFDSQADNRFQFHPSWYTNQHHGPPEPERIPREQPRPPCSGQRSFGHHGPPYSEEESPGQRNEYLQPEPPVYSPSWHEPTHDRSSTQTITITEDITVNVSACVAACPVVGDNNPVCGTNNVTYANFETLQCAQNCGVVVELSSSSSCQTQKPRSNMQKVISECISTCSVTSEYNPVCGTNDVTYQNFGRFECEKNCGVDVELSRMSSCSVPPGPSNPDLRLTTTESPKINGNLDNNKGSINNLAGNCNTNGGNAIKPSVTEVIACMQQCPMTAEVNPVCGTDGVTYTNPGKLLCTQFCGVDVKVQKFSTCSGEPLPTAPPACPCTLPSIPPTTEECIRRCSVTQELKPVCGSDGVTYINIESLKCKMGCGVDVSVQKLSPCGEPSTDNVQTCIDKCNVTPEHKPVCGTNGQTYDSLARLQCAKRCGINVDVKNLTACDETQVTISPDVLASIFPEDFKPSTPKDSEEDYIDQRFGD